MPVLAAVVLVSPSVVSAASTAVVTPSDTKGWNTSETRTNGQVNFVADMTAPLGTGTLQLLTGDSTPSPSQDKANYSRVENQALSGINELSYQTKQVSSTFVAGSASYQLSTCLYGVTTMACVDGPGEDWANLVFEPYVSEGNAAVLANQWQTWNVAAGNLWATRDIGTGTMMSGYETYTLSQLKSLYPSAVVIGQAVNVGSGNPNWDIRVDAVNFNGTLYNFEQKLPTPTDKDQCKKDGFRTLSDKNGNLFKNQGQCVSSVVSNR